MVEIYLFLEYNSPVTLALSDRAHPMATKRYREKFTFWLNLLDEREFAIAELISELKRERKFASTIRDGIRLICDLRQGRVDVLFELFPWVKSEFIAGVQPHETAGEKALKEQLKRIEQQLLQQGHTPVQLPASTGPTAMRVPQIETPAYDDDDIVLKKDTSTDSAKNFLQSMMNLQQ
jgi:hypothetical protein